VKLAAFRSGRRRHGSS